MSWNIKSISDCPTFEFSIFESSSTESLTIEYSTIEYYKSRLSESSTTKLSVFEHSSSELSTSGSSAAYFTSAFSLFKTKLMIKEIARKAKDVVIDVQNLKILAKWVIQFLVQNYEVGDFYRVTNQYLRHPPELHRNDPKTFDWLFVLNALNFSLFIPNSAKQWTVYGTTGYIALRFALLRAIREGKPIWNPYYYSRITRSELEFIFRSDDNETKIPLIAERVWTLHELGEVLINKYKGSFINVIILSQGDADTLLYTVFNDFEAYHDLASYEGELEVYLGSKAITLLSDLRSYNQIFMSIHTMPSTILVDSRSPEVFLHLGVLRYSNRLVNIFQQNEPLVNGCNEDMEIRCCSLFANKLLFREVLMLCENYTEIVPDLKTMSYSIPILIDNFFWWYRYTMDKDLDKSVPHHNITGIYF